MNVLENYIWNWNMFWHYSHVHVAAASACHLIQHDLRLKHMHSTTWVFTPWYIYPLCIIGAWAIQGVQDACLWISVAKLTDTIFPSPSQVASHVTIRLPSSVVSGIYMSPYQVPNAIHVHVVACGYLLLHWCLPHHCSGLWLQTHAVEI